MFFKPVQVILLVLVICVFQIQHPVTSASTNNPKHPWSIKRLRHGAVLKKVGRIHNHLAYGHLHLALRMDGLLLRRNKLVEMNDHIQQWNIYRIKKDSMMHSMILLREWVNRTVYETTVRIDTILLTMGGNSTDGKKRSITDAESQRYFQEKFNELHDKLQNTGTQKQKQINILENKNPIRINIKEKKSRKKRQLLVALGGAIVGGFISSIISDFQQTTLVDVIQKKQDIMSAQIQDNLIRTNQNEADIQRLSKAMAIIKDGVAEFVNETSRRLDAHSQMMNLLTSVSEEAHDVEKLVRAVEEARSGTFNLGLCEPHGLASALEHLQKMGLRDGRSLGINTMLDLSHMPMSYLIDVQNRILHVFLHVPMERSGQYLTLLQFIDSPARAVARNDTPLYLEVDVKGAYLAIAGDQSKYMTYDEEDLRLCHRVQTEYFCPNLVIYKESRKSCIKAIYDNDIKNIQRLCPLTLTNEISKATRLNGSTYIVTETTPQLISMTCGPEKQTQKRRISGGTYEIYIPKGCVLSTDNLLIEHPNFEPNVEVQGIVTTSSLEITNWIHETELPEFLKTAEGYLDQVGVKVPITHIKALTKFKKDMIAAEKEDWEAWLSQIKPGGLLSHIVTICTVLLFFVIIFKLIQCVKIRRNKGLSFIPWPTAIGNSGIQGIRNEQGNNRQGVNSPLIDKQQSMRLKDLNNAERSFEEQRAEDVSSDVLLENQNKDKLRRRQERRDARLMEKVSDQLGAHSLDPLGKPSNYYIPIPCPTVTFNKIQNVESGNDITKTSTSR